MFLSDVHRPWTGRKPDAIGRSRPGLFPFDIHIDAVPELPEVETMRRGLLPLVGGIIDEIEFPEIPYRPIPCSPEIETFRKRARGRSILGIDRIAKRVLVRLDNGDSIVMQPKMAGLALIADPPSQQHVRMVAYVRGAAAARLIYWDRRGLGTVHLWTPEQCALHLGPDTLGPDALAIEAKDWVDRFAQLKRPVKPALLDQKRVAGIGNLYASEILHRARVHPWQKCSEIPQTRWIRIYRAMREILTEAILAEGSTLGDGTYRNAVNGEGGYQSQHRVYARGGERCGTCGKGIVERIVQAQRSTFFCPRCQRLKG
jgi:formamidopyrimidine-DNA glycosylase